MPNPEQTMQLHSSVPSAEGSRKSAAVLFIARLSGEYQSSISIVDLFEVDSGPQPCYNEHKPLKRPTQRFSTTTRLRIV